MSDFDREAEREKLRKQFERDKKKREASEQMSELLLQGATMTNRHCQECHSPIFRYDGREFCPTCQREVTENGEFVGEEPDDESTEETAEPPAETAAPAEGDGRVAEERTDEETEIPTNPEAESGSESDPEADPESRPAHSRDRPTAATGSPAHREEGDLAAAEASLVRTLTDLTRQAEDARDVGRKREYLAAAREAAETLQALRRA